MEVPRHAVTLEPREPHGQQALGTIEFAQPLEAPATRWRVQDPRPVVLEDQDGPTAKSRVDRAGHERLPGREECLTKRGRLRRAQQGRLRQHEALIVPRRNIARCRQHAERNQPEPTGQQVTAVVRDLG